MRELLLRQKVLRVVGVAPPSVVLQGKGEMESRFGLGWSDVQTACGFGLDYLDHEEDAQVPYDLQGCSNSGELFFWDPNDALDFHGQLQASGAITGRRKLPWRCHCPDTVRDTVLARLLALNAERYAEEVALGFLSKGAKKPTGAKQGASPREHHPMKPTVFNWNLNPYI